MCGWVGGCDSVCVLAVCDSECACFTTSVLVCVTAVLMCHCVSGSNYSKPLKELI